MNHLKSRKQTSFLVQANNCKRKDMTDIEDDSSSVNDNVDEMILEWASKLELETVELRDKSQLLINLLTNKQNELNNCIDKLNKQDLVQEFKSLFNHQTLICFTYSFFPFHSFFY